MPRHIDAWDETNSETRLSIFEMVDFIDCVVARISEILTRDWEILLIIGRALKSNSIACLTLPPISLVLKRTNANDADRGQHVRECMVVGIRDLTELSEIAQEVEQIRQEIETRRATHQRELDHLDEQFEVAEFEKNKKIGQLKRDQELALAELSANHKKDVLEVNMKAAEEILELTGKRAVAKSDWEALQIQLQEKHELDDTARTAVRKEAEEDLKRAYNITTDEIFDVTTLFYQQKSSTQEAATPREQIGKLESEISRMRKHIELEPERISKAVEAAKVHIQNNIEQARSR